MRIILYKQLKTDSLKDQQNYLQQVSSEISSEINTYSNLINSSKINKSMQNQTKDLQEKNDLIESIEKLKEKIETLKARIKRQQNKKRVLKENRKIQHNTKEKN